MACVVIHEAAHALALGHADGEHGDAADEVIAQSVAFVVCDYAGLDAGDFSAHYAASWLRADPDVFRAGIGFVRDVSAALIAAIEPAIGEPAGPLVPCDLSSGTGANWAGTGLEMAQVRVTCVACGGTEAVHAGEEPRDLDGDTPANDQPYFGRIAA